jgi:nucleotide-binding universal stress UspA family protein
MSTTIRRIIHASDFSAASAPAFTAAVRSAKTNRAELLLIHVLESIAPVADESFLSPTLQREIREQGQKQLDQLIVKARKAGARARSLLMEGTPAEQILLAAKSERADLIVMGTHGRTGLARLFLGSVGERVLSAAPCPVLTVRDDQTEGAVRQVTKRKVA